MNATEKHQEFTGKLMALLKEFHKANPDLFVSDIDIQSNKYADQSYTLLGVVVTIKVQP